MWLKPPNAQNWVFVSENWLGIKQTISFDEFILIIWWQIFVLANAIRLATNRLKRSDNCYNNFCIKYICVVLFCL